MAKNRLKAKGRKTSGSFAAIPHVLLRSRNFIRLSMRAKVLLISLCTLYRGNNNGDLSCAWKVMQPLGWKSRETLHLAKAELEYYGFIIRTRQGGRNKATLYALTFKAIDECGGKLDFRPNAVPLNIWKEEKPDWVAFARKSLPK